MMYFSNAMGFLPGSQTMQDIDIFDQVTGESGAKTSVSWMGAFEKLLQAQMTDAPITPAQAEGSLRSFRAMMSNTLEKGAKGVAKNVFGYDAPGAFFSRYTGMSNLRAGEVYLPGRELDRVLGNIPGLTGKQRAAHKKRVTGGMTPEQVAAARAGSPTARAGVSSLESAYIPGFVFRQPDVSRDYGVMPAKYITAQQLAARGEDPGRVKSKFVDSGVSSLFSTIGVGDRDRDPLQGLVSIDKGGELIETKVQKQFFDAYARGNVVSASGQEVSTFDALQQVFGKQTSEYHIERSTTKDYVDVMSGEPGALSKGMAGQHLPFGEYQRAMEDWDISKENMNRTYNFMRRMESSRGGLGGAFSEKEFTENVFDPLQTMYQKAIDFSLEESPPLINALNTARVFKGADKKYRLGFNLYGDQRGTGDKFDWVSPLTAGSKGSGAVMRTLVEAIGRDKALVPDKTLGYMFAGSSEGAQRNVAALGRLEELKKSDPDKWGKVQRSSVLTGDVPVSDAGGTAIKPDISENSMLYTALWGRAAPASLGRYGNPPNEKYPEGKYTDIIADQESIMFPFKGKQTSLTDIAKDPAVLLSDIMYGYQRGTQTSRSARELTGAIGAARDIAGGPLTPEVIQRQPLAVQSFLSAAEVQLGSKKFRGMAEAPGSIDFEDKYLSVSKVRANEAFSKYMDLNLAGKPVLWASDMSAHFGKKPWNTMDKIAGGVMGLRSQTGSGLVDPKSTGSIIDKIFPVSEEKARLFKQGEEFESKWIKSIPGQGAGTEFKHSGQLRSLQYEYEGSEVHFKPDFLSWDPDNKTFNIVEHKLGKGKSAKYGGYQCAINV